MSELNRNWLRNCLPNVAVQCLNNSAVCVISSCNKVLPSKPNCDNWDKDVCKEEVCVDNDCDSVVWDNECDKECDKECWVEDNNCNDSDDEDDDCKSEVSCNCLH